MIEPGSDDDRNRLACWLRDAQERTRALVLDLTPAQWQVPRSEILTPFLWECAHVTWFHERFVLREGLGSAPMIEGIDKLYDSATVDHASRWDLEALPVDEVLRWDDQVRTRQLEALQAADRNYCDLLRLAIFHEDMHAEAFAWMRQALSYKTPRCSPERADEHDDDRQDATSLGDETLDRDLQVEACRMHAGPPDTERAEWCGFDNERGGTEVDVEAFAISRRCVSELEFLAFVEDDAYKRREFWCDDGWHWLRKAQPVAPLNWHRESGDWTVREFDRKRSLDPNRPVEHVSWFEASAWCRWAGRRLPTEFEWERVAGGIEKRRFPWGEDPDATKCNTGFVRTRASSRTCAQQECVAGRCPGGTAQLIGNVWEWTSSVFRPYPGFEPGVYANYSAPFFESRRVLRGGSWATMQRMLSSTMRNFFEPERRDIFAGFRTCAL